MAAASLLGPSYVNPSAAHTPSCRLHHWRPPKASLSFPHLPPASLALHLGGRGRLRQRQQQETRRGDCLLARAGPPSTATLVFAFVFPLSLIIGTIFASVRIADQLDEKFLQELAINKALMEEKEAEEGSEDELGEDGDGEGATLKDEQFISAPVEVASAAPRSRNRPKREA